MVAAGAGVLIALAACCAVGVLEAPTAHDAASAASAVPAAAQSSRAFFDAVRYAERKLWSSPYAVSSAVARRNTEAYLAGMISQAWTFSQQLEQLTTPYFNHGTRIDGLPGLYNPDNLYRSALLEPGGRYRIRGRRGTHTELTFQVLDRYPIVGLGKNLLVIRPDDLGIKPGDEFEIFLGGEAPRRPGVIGLPLPPEAHAVLARQTFSDWSASVTELRIERLDEAMGRRTSSQPPLERVASVLRQIADLWIDGYLPRIQRETLVNALPPPRASDVAAGGLGGQTSIMARYRIAPDEALLITVRKSDAPYQGIQLGDPWFVTPNFVAHQASLTSHQALVDSDGAIRFVVALSDPGVPNWLDAADNPEGYVFMRWQGLRAPLAPEEAPTARLVKLVDLLRLLPAGTPTLSADARRAQLGARRHVPQLR